MNLVLPSNQTIFSLEDFFFKKKVLEMEKFSGLDLFLERLFFLLQWLTWNILNPRDLCLYDSQRKIN